MATATRTVLFPWKDSYSVRIDLIDTQHKKLVQLINDLHDAMMTRKSREENGRIIAELVNYTKFHFSAEEQLLQQHGYKELVSHKLEHDGFTAKIAQFQHDYQSGSPVLTIGLMSFLKDWLREHIMVKDQNYAAVIHAKAAF